MVSSVLSSLLFRNTQDSLGREKRCERKAMEVLNSSGVVAGTHHVM